MSFIESIKTCFGKYAVFSGRARRSEYWWFVLFQVVMGFIPILGLLVTLVTLIPNIAVTTRRLHDVDRSGWWQVAPAGMMVLTGVMASINANILAGAAGLAGVVLMIVLIVWLAQEGTSFPNRFGPDPLQEGAPDAASDADVIPDIQASNVPRVKRKD